MLANTVSPNVLQRPVALASCHVPRTSERPQALQRTCRHQLTHGCSGSRSRSAQTLPCRAAVEAERATSSTSTSNAESPVERRLRESQRVDERVTTIYNYEEFQEELKQAGSMLVVVEIESSEVCQTGMGEDPEIQYKADRAAAQAPCSQIKHVFARTARDSPDVRFLALEADTEEGQAACDALGVEVLPSVQFWKDSRKLWEHRGIVELQQGMGEGVLYYGDSAAHGVKASTFVTEIKSQEDLSTFIGSQGENVLTVLDVSTQSASPCVKIFPAVLALAKNFVGYAAFGRLLADASAEASQLCTSLKVVQVPTFIFYRAGKEVHRFVSSSRGDLIGQILQAQNALGIAPPPPQKPGQPRRR